MERARALPAADFAALPYGDDPWRLVADNAALGLAQTPPVFALGNGFIGLRGPGGGGEEATLYLNGVHERVPIPYHEAAHGYARHSDTRLAASDPSALTITIDGHSLSRWDDASLDLRTGMLRLSATIDGIEITLERLVAMERNAIATRVSTIATRPVRVAVTPCLAPPPAGVAAEDGPYDPRVGPALAASPWREVRAEAGVRLDRLATSGWGVAVSAAGGGVLDLASGEEGAITIVAAVAAGRDDSDDELVTRTQRDLTAAGDFDALAAAQAEWFARFWAGAAIDFFDAPRAEQAMRHALFQLVQAAGRDGATSLAAKGQTGEGYEGHVFWDAESYAIPALVHLAPAIARAMLAWRIAGLDDARANARAMGQERGALYPWRTIGGRECSSFFPAGSAQYHINADIAHALQLYVAATGDRSILDGGGAELLVETARIWLAIGYHDPARDDAFVINRVTGPDEYSAIVDNNFYTNLLAAEHLRFAADEGADWLDPGEAAAMRAAADAMYLPHDAARGIPAQDDDFFSLQPWPFDTTPADRYPLLIHYHPLTIYRHRVAKQADAVLAIAIRPDAVDRATRARMLAEYERVTVHDSTLSASAFAIAAAGVGDADRAFDYWRLSALTDLGDMFGNSGHGLHMAALAGAWNALAYGFGGMQVIGGLRFAPIAVPALGAYAFTIAHHGQRLRIAVADGRVRYELAGRGTIAFRHGDEDIRLGAVDPVAERPLA